MLPANSAFARVVRAQFGMTVLPAMRSVAG